MKHQTRSLLSAAQRQWAGRPPTRSRCRAELRARILAHVEGRRTEGADLSTIAVEVGLTAQTLSRCLQDGQGQPKLRPALSRPGPVAQVAPVWWNPTAAPVPAAPEPA